MSKVECPCCGKEVSLTKAGNLYKHTRLWSVPGFGHCEGSGKNYQLLMGEMLAEEVQTEEVQTEEVQTEEVQTEEVQTEEVQTEEAPVDFSETQGSYWVKKARDHIERCQQAYLEAGGIVLRKVKHLSLSYDEEKTQNETVRNLAVSIGENNFKEADEILIELDEWVKETLKKRADLEKEKEQLKKGAKRLKASTIKAYSESQLRRHLDRLQDCFIDPLYMVQYGKIYKYEKEENAYFFYGKSKEAIIDCIIHSYRELGI